MGSFEAGVLDRQRLTHALLRTVSLLSEYKGKQQLFREQQPQVLEALRTASIIQSTEASNRIEGVVASPERLRALVVNNDVPRTRSEQEIAGYRDVLNIIHANYEHMDLTPGLVLQLHRDLFQFLPSGGGRWKPVDNEISEVRDGQRILRFAPVQAHLTAEAMEHLHRGFRERWREGSYEPLLLIGAYVLDFLCIHPFLDGNGRMARLLTLLLLYQAGYEVGRYISLERIIEHTRESYYDTLHASSQGWHESEHTLQPWWEYFLGVLLASYRDFEQSTGRLTSARGARREQILDVITRLPKQFRRADIERVAPSVSSATLNRALAQLRTAGKIRIARRGRDALWEKVSDA